MEKNLKLDIITTDRVVFSGDVISVTAPGKLGEFQILYNHAPLVSTLDTGRIKIVDSSGKEISFSVSNGILEVRNNKIIILADAIEQKEEIDVVRAEKALGKAQEIINSESNINKEEELLAIKRAKNRIKLAKS